MRMNYINGARQRHTMKLMIKVTHECNLNCGYCIQGVDKSSYDTFSLNPDIINYIDNFEKYDSRKMKIDTIQFTGGEPLLKFNDIRYIVEHLKGSYMYILITNGLLLNEDIIQFCNRYNIRLLISWDGKDSFKNRGYDVFDDKYDELLKINNLEFNTLITNNSFILDKLNVLKTFHTEYLKLHGFTYNKIHLRPIKHYEYTIDTYKRMRDEVDIICNTSNLHINHLYAPFIKQHIWNCRYHSIRTDGFILRDVNKHEKICRSIYDYLPQKHEKYMCDYCCVKDYCCRRNGIYHNEFPKDYYCSLYRITHKKLVKLSKELFSDGYAQ